jgi:hypothetical protein
LSRRLLAAFLLLDNNKKNAGETPALRKPAFLNESNELCFPIRIRPESCPLAPAEKF